MNVNQRELSTTDEKLVEMLNKNFVSEYYIENILIILKNDENKQKLIDYLRNGETNRDKILLKTAEINRGIKKGYTCGVSCL